MSMESEEIERIADLANNQKPQGKVMSIDDIRIRVGILQLQFESILKRLEDNKLCQSEMCSRLALIEKNKKLLDEKEMDAAAREKVEELIRKSYCE